jgi:peptide/nickel transport system permease protein
MIPVLFGVTIVSFFIIRLAPGTPLDLMVSPALTGEARALLERSLGLDAPLYRQYISWLGNVLHGNLGYSYSSYRPVTEVIAARIPATLLLAGSALLLGLLAALPVGIVCALKPRSLFDRAAAFVSFFGISTPNFFLGFILIYIFSIKLKVLPSGGISTPGGPWRLSHLALPCTVLALNIAGRFSRHIRSSLTDALHQDYMRAAAAKGLPYLRRVLVHGLRNALLPLITLLGLELPSLIGGAIVTEQIFSWPGVGRLTMDSILARDYPVLMGLTLMAALAALASSLVTDLLYAAVDPRVRVK